MKRFEIRRLADCKKRIRYLLFGRYADFFYNYLSFIVIHFRNAFLLVQLRLQQKLFAIIIR